MALRDRHASGEIELRQPAAPAPLAQDRCKAWLPRHEYLPGSCANDDVAQHATGANGKTGRSEVGEWVGVALALSSSCLGGTAAAIPRYLVGNADPVTLAILRWGIGFACLLPTALLLGVRWPPRRDWPAVALLGICFFGLFFILYNIAIGFTTAARASLALATLPLHTMVVGALLGIEPLTRRKSIGVGVAVLGVIAALASGLSAAPSGAWRGELIMTGAGLCMAV